MWLAASCLSIYSGCLHANVQAASARPAMGFDAASIELMKSDSGKDVLSPAQPVSCNNDLAPQSECTHERLSRVSGMRSHLCNAGGI
jgi:hypothetical protein